MLLVLGLVIQPELPRYYYYTRRRRLLDRNCPPPRRIILMVLFFVLTTTSFRSSHSFLLLRGTRTVATATRRRSIPNQCSSNTHTVPSAYFFHYDSRPFSTAVCAEPQSEDETTLEEDHNHNNNIRIQQIQTQVQSLTMTKVNLNSPFQVSQILFGNNHTSTSKTNLLRLTRDNHHPQQQQQLVSLILEYRNLIRNNTRRKTTTTTTTSTTSSTTPTIQTKQDDLQPHPPQLSSYQDYVQNVLFGTSSSSRIDPYWKEPLQRIQRPMVQQIVQTQLDPKFCPMGYNPNAAPHKQQQPSNNMPDPDTNHIKKGSFVHFCQTQKLKYPHCILLTRCGDFYEALGLDACLLMEHANLNPMAGKAKAGCPKHNIQNTLDALVDAGFSIAVVEEANTSRTSTSLGPSSNTIIHNNNKLKERFLAQIVSAASPTYMYNLVLSSDYYYSSAATTTARPYVGIWQHVARGYTMVEIYMEEMQVNIQERLTMDALLCRLEASPPSEPLFCVVGNENDYTVLQKNARSLSSDPSNLSTTRRIVRIPETLVEEPSKRTNDAERAKTTILRALLHYLQKEVGGLTEMKETDFTMTCKLPSLSDTDGVEVQPLHLETAKQLGLMDERSIPSLLSYILPESAPASVKRYVRRSLLRPPPSIVGDAMRSLVHSLRHSKVALPPLLVPPLGKVLALIRAEQASAQVFGEIIQSLRCMVHILDNDTALIGNELQALLTILEYESGLAADPTFLRQGCIEVMEEIQDVVSSVHHHHHHGAMYGDGMDDDDSISYFGCVIPEAFFERNEAPWRNRVRRDAIPDAYIVVEEAAMKLAVAVAEDFWCSDLNTLEEEPGTKSPIVQDIFNNIIALKSIPKDVNDKVYVHPRDRNGKVLRNRYTTERIQNALAQYVSACESASNQVASALSQLSRHLSESGRLPIISQASHGNLVMSAAFHHSIESNRRGWNIGTMSDEKDSGEPFINLKGVWPYWMNRAEAVPNSFDLSGMWMLTSPNMSGKSTIMRSTAAACLLTACGFCAPLEEGSTVQRFDHLFVRGASSDVPVEKKSAFGAEMGDIAAVMRLCGERSLVFVDELGRGTSPRDGTRLAAAILEAMACGGMNGIFATHLHDIVKLPLRCAERISYKRMKVPELASGEEFDGDWSYLLEDGICTDSLALLTASRFGLSDSIIKRAEALGSSFLLDENYPGLRNETGLVPNSGQAATQSPLPVGVFDEICDQENIVSIPPGWHAPSSLDGQSCVYILKFEGTVPSYYVGETDNIRSRIMRHRSKSSDWANAHITVLPVENKTQARSIESILIRKLAQAGYAMESIHDGRRER